MISLSPQHESAIEIGREEEEEEEEEGKRRRRKKKKKKKPPPSQDCLFFFPYLYARACACGACAPLVPSIRTRSWMFNKEIKCLNSHQKKKKPNKQKNSKKQKQKERKRKKIQNKQTNKQGTAKLYFKPAGTSHPCLPSGEGGLWPVVEELQGGSSGGQRPRDALGATGQEAEETQRGERDRGPPRAARGWGARSGTGAK